MLPHVDDQRVLAVLQEGDDVLVQRVHVLGAPVGRRVVDAAGVVDDGEVAPAKLNDNETANGTVSSKFQSPVSPKISIISNLV